MGMTIERNIELKLAKDEMNVAVLDPLFKDSDLNTFFSIDRNAKTKKKIPFMKFKQNLLRPSTGCTPQEVEAVEISSRCFDLQSQSFRAGLCYDEFKDTIFMGMANKGLRKPDLTNTVIGRILVDAATFAIQKDLVGLGFFGKTGMASIEGAEYLQVANGIWSYHIPLLQAESKLQFTAQNTALVGGTGDTIKFLRKIYNKQKNTLKGLPASQKYLAVSRSVFEAYREDLEAVQNSGAGNTAITENGREVLKFYNIPVIEMCDWDSILTTLGIDVASTPPNLAMLTTKSNLWAGTDSENPSQELEIWYDRPSKKNYLDSMFDIDFNFLHADFFSVGANEAVITALGNL